MTIQALQISYPSFQLGATIDPEQFNTNNGEIVSKVNEVVEEINDNINYVHPTTDGYHHIPATGTNNNNKVLKSGATPGSEAWGQIDYSEILNTPSFLNSLDTTGYQKLPNGLIIQWGNFSGTGTKTFSIPFPNACLLVLSNGSWQPGSSPPYLVMSGIAGWDKNGFNYGTFGYFQLGTFGQPQAYQAYTDTISDDSFAGQSRWYAIGY